MIVNEQQFLDRKYDNLWQNASRPGYFGSKRDAIIGKYNRELGIGKWRLAWVLDGMCADFLTACQRFYEESYFLHLSTRPADVDYICSFGDCIDNANTNVLSGCDYMKQEAFSTHIQDIAIRNVLRRLGRKFEGPSGSVLVIRSKDSMGFRFGPGNIPFMLPQKIIQPSLCPTWAGKDSVEDFWQSNKFLQVLV